METPTPAPAIETPAPVAAPIATPDAAAPTTVSASVEALGKNDFDAFHDAEVAKRSGTPKPDAPVTATPAEPKPAAEPTLSKRQQDANERTRLAVERATADLQRELAELRQRTAPPAAATPPAPTAPPDFRRYASMPNAPKLNDVDAQGQPVYASLEEHAAAMTLFVNQRLAEDLRDRSAHDEQRQRFAARNESFATKLRTAADADPTFVEKIPPALVHARPLSGLQAGERATFANVAAEAAYRSDHPEVLLPYLHAHQDETLAIAKLPPDEWLHALMRLDGRLTPTASTAPAPAASASPSPISAAPPPAPTLKGAGTSGDPKAAAIARGDWDAFHQIERAARVAKRSA